MRSTIRAGVLRASHVIIDRFPTTKKDNFLASCQSMPRRHGVHILNSLNELSFISIKNIACRFSLYSQALSFNNFSGHPPIMRSAIAIYQFAKQMSGNPAI